MAVSRLFQRTLSAFKPSNRMWAPVPSRYTPGQVIQQLGLTSRFSLITQNLDAFSPRPVARAKLLLDGILESCKGPDIIFLQEVTSDVHYFILSNPKVREAFLVTDAEDQTSFEGVPFANMMLLSSKRFDYDLKLQNEEDGVERSEKFILGSVFRINLPSKYGRCALSIDIIPHPTQPWPHVSSTFISIPLGTRSLTVSSRWRSLPTSCVSLDAVVD